MQMPQAEGPDTPVGATPTEVEPRPLCVDLDGTLVATDSLVECVLRMLKASSAHDVSVAGVARRGRAYLKREIAARADMDAATLPYHADLLEYLRAERARGRRLVLVTAADETHRPCRRRAPRPLRRRDRERRRVQI